MADTCSGIYFWSWSTPPPSLPPGPRLARSGCPRTSPGTRSFSPIEFNGYPRRLIYWMRSFAPPARNDFATVAHRCRPPPPDGGKKGKEGGALSLRKKISILTRVKIRLVHLQKIFLLAYGMGGFGEISSESVSKVFLFEFNWLALFNDWKKKMKTSKQYLILVRG